MTAVQVDYRRQTVTQITKKLPPALPEIKLAADAIALGAGEYGPTIALSITKLLEGRLLIQGVSGAGKSWTLRRLLEQSAGMIQQIVVDPEGEFGSLAESFGHLVVDASRLDIDALLELGARVRAQKISVVLDVSDLPRGGQMRAVTAFLNAIVEAPRDHWSTCIVAVDEAHLFAPFGALDDVPPAVRKASIAAVADIMGRGRKRGLVGVLATLRLARLAKSAASDVHNVLIGKNTLDLDIKRAGEMIGWGGRKASDRLPALDAGCFVAVGNAFSQSPCVVNVGAVASKHEGATPELTAPSAGLGAGEALGLEQLMAESDVAGDVEETRLAGGTRAVRMFIRDPGFKYSGAAYEELKKISPDGTTLESLTKHLGCSEDELTAAIALLHSYGVLELGDAGAVRIDHNFAKWRL